ncbi:N-(5'-phosphoribosyl)anthranilate isomerase [Planctomycetes bacterium Pan216]|uniref:N-(5'-phosphoribosyl)anthranilate isomerase n=1 Tax=Kolteria novifilia TaxID=2527975 RepID=A0A518AYT8_9BACT|nr:N-(5'-phosphoribosyl)anthranilate isomerase [Planctomycetes bacterium Pan216]
MMQQRTRIKICGITSPEDAIMAVGGGRADAIGLNFCRESPRRVSLVTARSIVSNTLPGVEIVGVFRNADAGAIRDTLARTGVHSVQLHGSEPPALVAELAPLRVVRAFSWKGPETAALITTFLEECDRLGQLPKAILLDTHRKGIAGGTGMTWDWDQALETSFDIPMILAGGLNPENVGDAIRLLRPFGVDVASGVESAPGVKDYDQLAAFFRSVREADELVRA